MLKLSQLVRTLHLFMQFQISSVMRSYLFSTAKSFSDPIIVNASVRPAKGMFICLLKVFKYLIWL